MKYFLPPTLMFVAFFGGFYMAWNLRPPIEVKPEINQITERSVIYNGEKLKHCAFVEPPCDNGFGNIKLYSE